MMPAWRPAPSLTCTASYIVTQADLDGGSVTNTATAYAYFNGSQGTSNEATATVTAEQHPALKLTKTASPTTYDAAGQTISYSYLLENSGNVTLAGPFTVSDNKATVTCPATASLAPDASLTCTASYNGDAGRPRRRLGHQHRHSRSFLRRQTCHLQPGPGYC